MVDVDFPVAMPAARAALGHGVALTGNFDPVRLVCNDTPDRIRAAVLTVYEQVGNPFLVSAGCEIPPGTPPANLHALCEPVAYRP